MAVRNMCCTYSSASATASLSPQITTARLASTPCAPTPKAFFNNSASWKGFQYFASTTLTIGSSGCSFEGTPCEHVAVDKTTRNSIAIRLNVIVFLHDDSLPLPGVQLDLELPRCTFQGQSIAPSGFAPAPRTAAAM